MLRIDINGPAACGKSFVAKKVVELLEDEGYIVLLNEDHRMSDHQVELHVKEAIKTGKRVALVTDGGLSEQSREQAQAQHRKGW